MFKCKAPFDDAKQLLVCCHICHHNGCVNFSNFSCTQYYTIFAAYFWVKVTPFFLLMHSIQLPEPYPCSSLAHAISFTWPTPLFVLFPCSYKFWMLSKPFLVATGLLHIFHTWIWGQFCLPYCFLYYSYLCKIKLIIVSYLNSINDLFYGKKSR